MSPAARALWGWPIVLGVLTAVGLVAALLADGGWDLFSGLALAAPLAVAWWAPRRRGGAVKPPQA
jgi:hypothetical protein